MKLYTYDRAPNPRRLGMFLKYKGIEIETAQVDLRKAEQLTDEYRAINPEMTVPALKLDDGTVLSEVIGICTYLEQIYPDRPLLGTTALERALVVSWDHRLFAAMIMPIADMLRNSAEAFRNRALAGPYDVPQLTEMVERGRLQLHYILPDLDAKLARGAWLAGDNFTFADIDLLAAVDFMAWVKESVPEECAHLKAWYARAQAELA
ncbi:MAG TPA: glutathione S-transferase family protein [Accumulibacter sp.]|uniref:glutathione S-transferase family protein n=1 Tax=Accumulibacter sp. TaxID=2053492 RepID=UPI002CA981C1|nr:glutathione S-transferase family protein [Accumulibacter sp.]HRF74593.1 glutathione S-transferase family protein [Accumulibacter sp.]